MILGENRYETSLPAFKERIQARIIKAFRPFSLTLSPGRFIRSELVYLFGLGPLEKKGLETLAFGAEGVHTASLFLDDIIDREQIRRGMPALFRARGEKKAISFSFLLLTRILQNIQREFPSLQPLFFKAFEKMCLGELENQDEKNYLRVCYRKTGVLFALSVILPLLGSTATSDDLKRAYRFGRNLGIAYQLKDDWQDNDCPLEREKVETLLNLYRQKTYRSMGELGFMTSEARDFLARRVEEWLKT